MARKRLPETRHSITHSAIIITSQQKLKLYITVGLYPDGAPGEVFITFNDAEGSINGLADSWATAISLCLQHGVKLKTLVDKFSFVQFEPSGMTDNQAIPMARSIVDYVVRWMASVFPCK